MIIPFWIWSPKNTRKTPSYPAHFRIAAPVARNALRNAAFGCQRADCPSSFPLELCLQLCVHKLPKLIALCFLAVRVLNFGVEHVRFVGTLTFASFCNMLHVIKTPRSAFRLLSKLWRTPPVPTWSSPKPCCPVSPGPQETARTTQPVLTSSIPRGDCPRSDVYRLHRNTNRSARPGHSSSLQSNTRDTSCCVSATAAKSFNSLENLRTITPDALLTESSAPKPEAACNSHSATATKS